ncbi:MAG: ribokinase [Planctomycetota bacterium]
MATGPIVVVGSAVVDRVFAVETLPLPGESALAETVRTHLGGKGANQAVAARRLGAPVVFVGRVGDDDEGRAVAADLASAGVTTHLRTTPGVPTGYAAVLVDADGENQIAVHLGANDHVGSEALARAAEDLGRASVLLTQLEIPVPTILEALEAVGETETLTVLNAAPHREETRELVGAFDLVVLNRMEAEQVAEVGIATVDDALAALRAIKGMGARDAVITLGPAGAVFFDHGRGALARAPQVETVDSTGAGDAFVGALAVFLRDGLGVDDAMRRAVFYASQAVEKPGARGGYLDREAFEAIEPDWN